MPGGRQAYIPVVKAAFRRLSWSSPSKMYTSSQKSWTITAEVSTPGGNFSSRVPTPVEWSSITTTLPKFGQFLAGNRFAKTKNTKLSSAWAGRHGEVLKAPFLRSVVVILGSGFFPPCPPPPLPIRRPPDPRERIRGRRIRILLWATFRLPRGALRARIPSAVDYYAKCEGIATQRPSSR